MSILNGLKGILFETEEAKPVEKKTTEERKTGEIKVETPRFAQQTTSVPQYQIFPQTSGEIVVQPDANVLSFLADELTKKNLPGFDYFEFRDALQKMAFAIPDENLRYSTALASVSSIIDKAKIIETAKVYIEHLKFVHQDFVKVSASSFDSSTGLKKKRFEDIDQLTLQAEEQIRTLTQQISALRTEKIQLQGEIAAEEADFNLKNKKFEVSVTAVLAGIDKDIKKLETL